MTFGRLRRGSRSHGNLLLGGQSEIASVGSCCLIGFLRGQLINHGTPPLLTVTQSNPIAPFLWFYRSGWGGEVKLEFGGAKTQAGQDVARFFVNRYRDFVYGLVGVVFRGGPRKSGRVELISLE